MRVAADCVSQSHVYQTPKTAMPVGDWRSPPPIRMFRTEWAGKSVLATIQVDAIKLCPISCMMCLDGE
jgi:hypothetical protein